MADTGDTKDEATQAGLDHAEQVVDQAKAQTTGRSDGSLDDQEGNDQPEDLPRGTRSRP